MPFKWRNGEAYGLSVFGAPLVLPQRPTFFLFARDGGIVTATGAFDRVMRAGGVRWSGAGAGEAAE